MKKKKNSSINKSQVIRDYLAKKPKRVLLGLIPIRDELVLH